MSTEDEEELKKFDFYLKQNRLKSGRNYFKLKQEYFNIEKNLKRVKKTFSTKNNIIII